MLNIRLIGFFNVLKRGNFIMIPPVFIPWPVSRRCRPAVIFPMMSVGAAVQLGFIQQ
jgi:hypothetical protein